MRYIFREREVRSASGAVSGMERIHPSAHREVASSIRKMAAAINPPVASDEAMQQNREYLCLKAAMSAAVAVLHCDSRPVCHGISPHGMQPLVSGAKRASSRPMFVHAFRHVRSASHLHKRLLSPLTPPLPSQPLCLLSMWEPSRSCCGRGATLARRCRSRVGLSQRVRTPQPVSAATFTAGLGRSGTMGMIAVLRGVQEELREAGGANANLARKRARYGPDAVSGLLPHQRMKDVQALCAYPPSKG